MDLKSLDRLHFQRSIQQEIERITSLPIELSAIENAKSILEGKLKDLTSYRDVATPEEGCELDAEIERLNSRLTKISAELAGRIAEERVAPGSDSRSEAQVEETTQLHSEGANYVFLLKQVLEKGKKNGESKKALLEGWLKENRGLSRTQVTDYVAGNVKGRVSDSKCKAIEAAILTSATELGLVTRTNSD